MMLAKRILAFYQGLTINRRLPGKVKVMNPYRDEYVSSLCRLFYTRFYNDSNSRTLILGINPGRFGGGVTGIPFTDPVKLDLFCGIPNKLPRKAELSADFIYAMIKDFGGPEKFYGQFYVSAVCPLGFTMNGKNLNYYDSRELESTVLDFCIQSIQTQLNFGLNCEVCFCLGEGKNFKFLNKINSEYKFFNRIIPLPHPRFIMQYRRKRLAEFISLYLSVFK